jgi:hypothetical protein
MPMMRQRTRRKDSGSSNFNKKEGVAMRALWLVPDEPEEQPVESPVAYGEPTGADIVIEEDGSVAPHPAPILAIWDDDDGFAEIPTRLTP